MRLYSSSSDHASLLLFLPFSGSYKLKADAARVHDKAAKLLQVPSRTIFSSTEQYKAARQKELDASNCSDAGSMSSRAVASHLFDTLIQCLNQNLANKWEGYFQPMTDKPFIESYQESVNEILGYSKTEPSKRMHSEVEDQISGNLTNCEMHDVEEESDDADSLFSDSSDSTPVGCL